MHTYSTDEGRVGVYGVLAVLSVAIAWLITALTAPFDWPDWLVSAPSMAAVFAFSFSWFDRVGWKWNLARILQLSQTPDLSGDYEGDLTSTFEDLDGHRVSHPIRIEIRQTWTRMSLRMVIGLEPRSSASRSVAGAVSTDAELTRLVYYYRNQINPTVAEADMGDHDGAAELEIQPSGAASGRYFNSRPRTGSITALKRMPS